MTNYRFIDSGDGRRLDQFGSYIIDRPAPQANYPKKLNSETWDMASAKFSRNSDKSEPTWSSTIDSDDFQFEWDEIKLNLHLSENGQVGIYPEQLKNWLWIDEQIKKSTRPLKVLNGFAYTGGSTLFASRSNELGEVCHLDASKSSVKRSRSNIVSSGLEERSVRFVVEDMITFMERELKRGNFYQGLILDPPAFGRAPGKKTWRIKRDLPKLLDLCYKLTQGKPEFILFSCHDPEISIADMKDMLSPFLKIPQSQCEELNLVIPSDCGGNDLQNGRAIRWSRK